VENAPDVSALLREAEAFLDVRRYEEAMDRAREVMRRAPDDARAFQVLSRAFYAQEDFSEAARTAQESIRLAPNDGLGYRLRSRALASMARHEAGSARARLAEEAVGVAGRAVQLAPADPNGHLVLAEALSLAKRPQEADAQLQLAIRSAPNSVATWVTASLIAIGAKNWPAAIEACHRALALDPNNYAALNNLGVALRASGQRRDGTQVLARAAAIEPDSTTARKNLSRAGIRIARLVVLVALIPLGFIANVGLVLYLVFAVGSNVLISRRPDLVLRAERWAAPLALFFARRRRRKD
jgi:tetratricopeptide (TPR) repeat protein